LGFIIKKRPITAVSRNSEFCGLRFARFLSLTENNSFRSSQLTRSGGTLVAILQQLHLKMNGLQEMTFISEIVLQSKIAQCAAERLQTANDNLDKVEVWGSIQSILVSTGNVSKILWPTYERHAERGKKLRQILKVENDNPLSERKFRNHFEHYDSRVEEWYDDKLSDAYIDLAMNPSLMGTSLGKIDRGYNSFNNTLIFRGEILDLNEILNALKEIDKSCKQYGYNW
jgi:hypothetical protein